MVLVWGNNKKGIVKAILISSALFGITHLLNIIADPVEEVIIQSIVVFLPGILLLPLIIFSLLMILKSDVDIDFLEEPIRSKRI